MKANVYVLAEQRLTENGPSMDIWMLGGTQEELLNYYETLKGHPPRDAEKITKDGLEHIIFDKDDADGFSIISQYKVGIQEVIED